MKKHTSNKIRLGIFVSIGIALFIVGIYFIGERQQLFRRTFRVSGVFRDVGGLQAGNNVRFSGINVGTIDNISVVSDSSVRVELLIDENIRKFIKKDAIASIGSEGLMGNKTLIITPGTGGKKEIENNDIVATVQPINMDDIMISLKTTIDNTSNITSDLSKITGNIRSGKGAINIDDILLSIKTTVDNSSNIASDLSKITKNIRSGQGTIGRLLMDQTLEHNIDSTFVNLKESSEGLRILMDNAKGSYAQNIDSTLVNLKEGSKELKNLIDAKSSTMQNFDSTLVTLKKGAAGFKILMDKAKDSWLLWGF
ncbi:MAG: MlaD family protein [Bacteroidota bacterium]|jgi:phospholipid/cholesterol/gamma-HCH transport system substrate-binding protein